MGQRAWRRATCEKLKFTDHCQGECELVHVPKRIKTCFHARCLFQRNIHVEYVISAALRICFSLWDSNTHTHIAFYILLLTLSIFCRYWYRAWKQFISKGPINDCEKYSIEFSFNDWIQQKYSLYNSSSSISWIFFNKI